MAVLDDRVLSKSVSTLNESKVPESNRAQETTRSAAGDIDFATIDTGIGSKKLQFLDALQGNTRTEDLSKAPVLAMSVGGVGGVGGYYPIPDLNDPIPSGGVRQVPRPPVPEPWPETYVNHITPSDYEPSSNSVEPKGRSTPTVREAGRADAYQPEHHPRNSQLPRGEPKISQSTNLGGGIGEAAEKAVAKEAGDAIGSILSRLARFAGRAIDVAKPVVRVVGRFGGPVLVAAGAIHEVATTPDHIEGGARAVGGIAGAALGGKIGAAIGTIGGPPGVVVGAIVGAGVGWIAGTELGSVAYKAGKAIVGAVSEAATTTATAVTEAAKKAVSWFRGIFS